MKNHGLAPANGAIVRTSLANKSFPIHEDATLKNSISEAVESLRGAATAPKREYTLAASETVDIRQTEATVFLDVFDEAEGPATYNAPAFVIYVKYIDSAGVHQTLRTTWAAYRVTPKHIFGADLPMTRNNILTFGGLKIYKVDGDIS